MNKQMIERIRAYLAVITDADLRMAFEIVPFSIIGNNDRFLEICRVINSPDLGVNLDTGHAWATRDTLALLPYKLKNRIFGLHLKDNNSDNNLPLAPGKGTIDWKSFLYNLPASGYTGNLDIEIGCSSEQVRAEYADGLKHIQSCL
jgi:sugar phosphate isomerase/epimerase